jgi:hypothetical protein
MVKSKKLSLWDSLIYPFTEFWNLKNFSLKKYSISNKIYFILFGLFLTFIIDLLKIKFAYDFTFSVGQLFLITFFGFVLFLFIFYLVFYFIFNAFNKKEFLFFDNFLNFLVLLFPFIIVGHILDLLRGIFFIGNINLIFNLIFFTWIIFSMVEFLFQLKNIYKSTFSIIFTTLLIEFILFYLILISSYLSLLISSLK